VGTLALILVVRLMVTGPGKFSLRPKSNTIFKPEVVIPLLTTDAAIVAEEEVSSRLTESRAGGLSS
jgi:hypothetical protein